MQKAYGRRGRIAAGALGAALAFSAAAGSDPPPLRDLVEAVRRGHPEIAAAFERWRRAEAGAAGADGFFDPRLAALAGWRDEARDLPGLTRDPAGPDEAVAAQAGVEAAFLPGFYAGVGAASWRPLNGAAGSDPGARAGARVRIPLLRDRGFGGWKADRASAEASAESAREEVRAALQRLEAETELRYIDLQLAIAQREVAGAATQRAGRLFREAKELVRLEAVPAYQVHPARLEVARRSEEETAAERAVRAARLRIDELAGAGWGARQDPVDLLAWGSSAGLDPAGSPEEVYARRGEYGRRRWLALERTARRAGARDALKHDVSLQAGLAWEWNGADESGAAPGGDVALVWRRALGDRAARAQAAAAEAQVREEEELLRGLRREIVAELEIARADFESAAGRLAWMAEAAESARAALEAEEERFRLGEGGSRQVLDAQKDLTDIHRRRNDILAELLRARARHRYAAGFGGGDAGSLFRETP